MRLIAPLIVTLALGCGPAVDSGDTSSDDVTGSPDGTTEDPATSSDTGGDGTTSADATTSTEGTTGGGPEPPEPIDPCDTTLTMGVSGLAINVDCDVGPPKECESPGAGRMIAAFDEDPRIVVDDFFPTELDPAILPIAETVADAEGRFEPELPAGTWVLCAVFGGEGHCRTELVIDDTQPLRTATHYSGNGDTWYFGTCPLR